MTSHSIELPTIEEVHRILLEHSARSACPLQVVDPDLTDARDFH